MFVTRSAGCFVAGGAESCVWVCCRSCGFWFGFWVWILCISCLSVWSILLNLFLMITIPVHLYIFYKWGNLLPIHISLPLVLWWHRRLPLLGVVVLSLWGVGVEVGWISQSFLNSNRLPDLVPVLGHGVPAWLGTFSSGRGCYLVCFLGEGFFL